MNLNIELTERETPLYLMYCNALGIKYETSQAFNMIHIALFNVTREQREKLDLFVERMENLEISMRKENDAGRIRKTRF